MLFVHRLVCPYGRFACIGSVSTVYQPCIDGVTLLVYRADLFPLDCVLPKDRQTIGSLDSNGRV